jgi:hypothetical protein
MPTRTPSADNPFQMPAEYADYPLLYRSLIRPIREADQKDGQEFLKRFYIGIQAQHNTIANLIASAWDNQDATTCPADLLIYLKDIVGWDAKYDYITDGLTTSDLRKLIRVGIPFWKRRFSAKGLTDIIRFITGRSAIYYDWFYWRAILGETFLSEEQLGYDFWLIGGDHSYQDEHFSQLRLMDDGTLDRQMVLDLAALQRPASERLEVALVDFLDQFDLARDKWVTLSGTAASITTDKTLDIPAGTMEQASVVDHSDTVFLHRFKLDVGAILVTHFYVEDWAGGDYYRAEVSKDFFRLTRWNGGSPVVIAAPTLTFPIIEGLWYKLRASVVLENQLGDILLDGNMEAVGVGSWIAAAFTTLSKETGTPYEGTQVLRILDTGVSGSIYAQNVNSVVSGRTYRITGAARADGAGTAIPVVVVGGTVWSGTTSTAWQPFDVTFVATGTSVRLFSTDGDTGGYVEFDDVYLIDAERRVKVYIDGNNVADLADAATAPNGGGLVIGALDGAEAYASDLMALCRFDDIAGQTMDLDYIRDGGTPTTANEGSPVIIAPGAGGLGTGCLEVTGQEGVEWIGANVVTTLGNVGAIRMRFKPNYSGTPAGDQLMFALWDAPAPNSAIALSHSSAGDIGLYLADGAGAPIIFGTFGAWSPTAGTWYEIELNFDLTTGATRVFIDGVQNGSTNTTTGTHPTGCDTITVGSDTTGPTSGQDFEADELHVFDTVQHTTGYTPATTQTLPVPAGSGADLEIDNVESFRTPLRLAVIAPAGTTTSDNFFT